ncbi:T9SS C-terminal target domain-containing protein [uncultured Parabacteroides sp.]|uniref:T9SS C-terminal target domain-containing protein n=1 Tax=uncultured Parabacteroides sp. TaxID=512312 RepID=UPI002632EA0C|nr:T9SS C-terminal target domain-containing protein [uncultured Parabacteroides sp.]
MKKRFRHLSRCVIACTTFLFVQQIIQPQVSNPSTWASFVQSSSNISVRDTFRMQTFMGLTSDCWGYTITGEASIKDISNVKEIPDSHGRYGLRMPTNTQVAFEHFTLTDYQDIKISVRKGGIRLVEGENMRAKTYREGETSYSSLVSIIGKNGIIPFKTTDIKNNPPGVDLIVPAPAATTKNGYYYVDSVYAHGMILSYSLFTGNGDWNDSAHWSHLPAYRHRKALIHGIISVNTDICCGEVFIGDGNIHISAAGNLSADNLTIYSSDDIPASSSALQSSGHIDIAGRITIEKTFAQKDKWYFISFPFDVYASGIDPKFQLGDNKSNTNGNYFYIQTYNGEKRANSQSLSDNWEVIPRTIVNTSQPIFKKNKGYLIALDASANRQTLRFASKERDIPSDFGKSGQVSIQITTNTQNKNQNHNGWYLCGNPLPAPLALNQIESNPSLDGYIYVYDGSTYRPYTIGSDLAIPPFSAFFVKANKNTNLSIHGTPQAANYKLLSANVPMSSLLLEPQVQQESPVSNPAFSFPELRYHLGNRNLYIDNLPSPGKVWLFTPAGIPVFTQAVQTGSSTIPLSLPQGLYLLIIQTGHYRTQYKCALTL